MRIVNERKVRKHKYVLSIPRKIWLSLSILVLGYMVSMIFGYLLGKETGARLNYISESRFPAAMQSKIALTRFNEQVKLYNDAVLFGEEDRLVEAGARAGDVRKALEFLSGLVTPDEHGNKKVKLLLKEFNDFTSQAHNLYSRMLLELDNEGLPREASRMLRRTRELRRSLKHLAAVFSSFLKAELISIARMTRKQGILDMVVFFLVIFTSIILVSFIIHRLVTRPLREAAALAGAMAEGDLSRKLDIRQKDEIGGLARAMNIMAEKVETSHAKLEQKVAERTQNLDKINKKLRAEIAERERTEAELKKTQKELVRAARLAEAANKSKSEFLANMSHEIRTPLTGIIGMAEILLNTPLSAEQKDFLETINVSSETLLVIINDILDISKIEAGEFSLASAPFDLTHAVENIVRIFTPQAEKKGIHLVTRFQPGGSYCVTGDLVRTRQIIFNLAGNALKFTHEGRVEIRVKQGTVTGNMAQFHIEVEDTGIGIEPRYLGTIFNKFTQVDSSDTRKYGGTGLGLSITRQLVELMGGSIRVGSTLRKGTIFYLMLPFPLATREDLVPPPRLKEKIAPITPPLEKSGSVLAEETVPGEAQGLSPLKILLAEDNKINQKLIGAILKKAGYRLDIVGNGKKAVEKVKESPYDLVLMDIQMPGLNGLDATKAIRESGYRQLPIIAMTASAFEEDKQMCLNAGMSDFLSKPLKQSALFHIISKWI